MQIYVDICLKDRVIETQRGKTDTYTPIHTQKDRETEREVCVCVCFFFHPFIHAANANSSQGQTKAKPKPRNSMLISHMVGQDSSVWDIIHCFDNVDCQKRQKIGTANRTARTEAGTLHSRCQCCKWQFKSLCHSVGPCMIL